MKLTKTEKLFEKAYHHNWDAGVNGLKKILADPHCDKATALLIYWHAAPAYYNQYESAADVPASERPVYDLIRSVEGLIASGELEEAITFTPPADRVPDDLGRIPAIMTVPTAGERDADTIIHGDKIENDFFEACCRGDVDTVRELREQHALDLEAKYRGYPPIALSVRDVELFDYLVAEGVDWKKKFNGSPIFHQACRAEDLAVANTLLELGHKVDATAKYRRTALHAVVFCDEEGWRAANGAAATTFLLKNGASLEAKDSDGFNALELAERAGNAAAADLLRRWNG